MTKIELLQGDITKLPIDAIVNAANSSLMGGGGVDGAIHRAGGKQIVEECMNIREKHGICETGKAVITNAGNLPCKYVIHTVGPVWNGGNHEETEKLKNCYLNSLKLAVNYRCKTIAFPNISTGVYGYPKEEAAKIAINTVQNFIKENNKIDNIIFICFDNKNYQLYKKILTLNSQY